MPDSNAAVLLSVGILIYIILCLLTSTNNVFLFLEHVWLDLMLLMVFDTKDGIINILKRS